MGNHLHLPATATSGEQHAQIVAGKNGTLEFKRDLGGNAFLKTFQYHHSQHGSMTVKVYTFRDGKERANPADVVKARDKVLALNERLQHARSAHFCRFTVFQIKESLAYMIRPFVYTSLHERAQIRPLLTHVDKLWIVFQLLEAVTAMHMCGVRHGDIKAENVLLTSWNWLLLSDLAPYKPVFIDLENDPTDFRYFFDTTGRRRCCLAPERFVKNAARHAGAHITAAMDVFSVGCTVVEVMTSEALFTYEDMVAYTQHHALSKESESRLAALDSVEPALGSLVRHMTQLSPGSRWGMSDYLAQAQTDIFPAYFEPLHHLLSPLLSLGRDQSVLHLQTCFANLLAKLDDAAVLEAAPDASGRFEAAAALDTQTPGAMHGGSDDEQRLPEPRSGEMGSPTTGQDAAAANGTPTLTQEPANAAARRDASADVEATKPADVGAESVDGTRVAESSCAGTEAQWQVRGTSSGTSSGSEYSIEDDGSAPPSGSQRSSSALLGPDPARAILTSVQRLERLLLASSEAHLGLLTLLASVLCSALRGATSQEARWAVVQMLLHVGLACDEHCVVEWIVPYLLHYCAPESTTTHSAGTTLSTDARSHDEPDTIPKLVVLDHLNSVLQRLESLSRSEWGLFNAFVMPALSSLTDRRAEALTREFTRVLPELACTALRLSDAAIVQAQRDGKDGRLQVKHVAEQLVALRNAVQEVVHTTYLPSHSDAMTTAGGAAKSVTSVWVPLMQGAGSLSAFFGPEITTSVFVPSFLWLANEPDWRVRTALYKNLPAVAENVGAFTRNRLFLPVLEAAIAKPDEQREVLVHALRTLCALHREGLIASHVLLTPEASQASSPRGRTPACCRPLQLLTHPSPAVRAAAVELFTSLADSLDVAGIYALLRPTLHTALNAEGPLNLNPVLYTEPEVVADFVRERVPFSETNQADDTLCSRIAQACQTSSSSVASAPHVEMSSVRRVAEAGNPLLNTSVSLHTLALHSAGIPRPALPTKALMALANGAACRQTPSSAGDPHVSVHSRTPDANEACEADAATVGRKLPEVMEVARRSVHAALLPSQQHTPATPMAEITAEMVRSSRIRNSAMDLEGDNTAASELPHSGVYNVPDTLQDFKPRGILVAHMAEHQNCVNSLSVSLPRNNWLATASSDGSVKMWGCAKDGVQVDKIGHFGAMLTYSAHDGHVTDVHFLGDDNVESLQLASVDSAGSLHIWDAAIIPRSATHQRPTLAFPANAPIQSQLDAGRIMSLRRWGPLILLMTELGGLRGHDTRVGARPVYHVPVPSAHGLPTCMALVPGSPALVSGSSRGMLHVWDLRMQMCVNSRWHYRQEPITALACPTASPALLGARNYPSNWAPLLYVASGGNEISLCDAQLCQPRLYMRAWQDRSHSHAAANAAAMAGLANDQAADIRTASFAKVAGEQMRALLPLPSGGLICAGSDKNIRYVHARDTAKSYMVCGPLLGKGHGDPPSFAPDVQYRTETEGDVPMLREEVAQPQGLRDVTYSGSSLAEQRARRRLLARCHSDTITSLAIASLPSGPVLISAGRDGMVKAWR